MRRWNVTLAGAVWIAAYLCALALGIYLLATALAFPQSFDDPRVADYAADLAKIAAAERQIDEYLAVACRKPEIAAKLAERCTQPMHWPTFMSVDEYARQLARRR